MISSLVAIVALAQATGTTPSELEADVLARVNAVRSKAGLKRLDWNKALIASAKSLAVDLASREVLEHQDRRGWKLAERVEEAGYRDWLSIGENIAYGQRSATEVVDDWLKSPGHRKMIYEQDFAETGIATAKSKRGTIYWVQQFGTR